MDVCLRCGADVRGDVVVTTVTEGVLPPAPPRVADPVWEHPARPDPAWGPEDPAHAPRPELSPTAAALRWLAVGGHALIAAYSALSLVVSAVAMAVAIRTIDRDPAATIAGTVVGVMVAGAISLWLASRTRRLWQTYDARRFRGALPGDILVALMAGASGLASAAGGPSIPLPLILALVGVPAGVTVLTVVAALLLPRPLFDAP
jgi:hypothetical protein